MKFRAFGDLRTIGLIEVASGDCLRLGDPTNGDQRCGVVYENLRPGTWKCLAAYDGTSDDPIAILAMHEYVFDDSIKAPAMIPSRLSIERGADRPWGVAFGNALNRAFGVPRMSRKEWEDLAVCEDGCALEGNFFVTQATENEPISSYYLSIIGEIWGVVSRLSGTPE